MIHIKVVMRRTEVGSGDVVSGQLGGGERTFQIFAASQCCICFISDDLPCAQGRLKWILR